MPSTACSISGVAAGWTGRCTRRPRPDRDVEDLFGNSQDLIDPRMAAAADQDQAKATDIDHQRLFGDKAKPEQHPRQRWQHGHAVPDHPRVSGDRDVGARMLHTGRHMRWYPGGLQRSGGESERAAPHRPRPAHVVKVQVGDHHGVQVTQGRAQHLRVVCWRRFLLAPASPESNSTRMPPALMR